MLVATNLQLFRLVAGPQWRPRSVHFRHVAPASLDVHNRIFRCKCVFDDDFNGMSCLPSDLDLVNPAVDPMMASYARRFLDNLQGADFDSPVDDVRRLIYLFLPTGRATIKQVAQSLGRNARTVQRELDRLGESFSSLLNHARRDLVVSYLANARFDIGHVAELLGYRRQGSFTRWFEQEFGKLPSDWRQGTDRATSRRMKRLPKARSLPE